MRKTFAAPRRLRGEDGMVLVITMIVMLTLSIASVAVYAQATSNQSAFYRDREANTALDAAEAGLNAAVNKLKASSADLASLPAQSGTVGPSSWSYTAARVQADPLNTPNVYTWTITATGISPNDTVTRIVKLKVQQTITPGTQTVTTTTPASAAYGFGFFLGDPASDCTTSATNANTFSASAQIQIPVYIRGSMCISGGGAPIVAEPTGSQNTVSLYVGGKFKTQSNASPVGTSTAKIASATIVGGCIGDNGSVVCSKQGRPMDWTGSSTYGSGVWATTYSSTQNNITRPAVDTAWYTNAKPGAVTGCNNHPTSSGLVSTYPSSNQSGTPKWTAAQFKQAILDNDSTRNTSLGTKDFLQLVNNWNSVQNSFDCRYYASDGTLVGRLAWTFPQNCNGAGTLIISGTVYIDGNLSFASCDYAIYQGRGTIYANGTVTFANGAKVCAQPISGSPCLGNYDQATNLLEIVAVNAGNAATAFSFSGAGTFEGVVFANGRFNAGNGASIGGPVVANTATMSGAAKVRTVVNPPEGAPGAATTTTVTTSGPDQVEWAVIPGSWQQLP